MTGFDRFEPASLEPGLTQLAASSGPIRVLLVLEGPARLLSSDVRLRMNGGQVVSARAGRFDGVSALALAFLATGGRVETTADPGVPDGEGTPLTSLLVASRTLAQDVGRLLAPLGGLGAPVRSRGAPSVDAPAVVQQVANLAKGGHPVARVMADSGHELILVSRVLRRLHELEQIEVVGPNDEADPLLPSPKQALTDWTMPQSGWGQTSKMPEADDEEFAGVKVKEDVKDWLSEEEAPPPLLDDQAFKQAFASVDLPRWGDEELSEAPAVAPTVTKIPATKPPAATTPQATTKPPATTKHPATTEPPAAVEPPAVEPPAAEVPTVEAEAPVFDKHPPIAARARAQMPVATNRPAAVEDDDDFLRAAGVESSNAPWVAGIVLFVVAVVAAFFFFRPTDDPNPRPDASVPIIEPPVMSSTTSTTTTSSITATATVTEDIPPADALRPTIAAADAPEEVRRAETLLDAQSYRAAAQLLRRLRQTRPQDPVVFVLSGQVSVDTGRLKEANRWAARAIQLDSRSFRARVLKGSVDQFSQRDKAALGQYRRALELGPNHPMSSEIRSVVRELERRQ